METDSNEMIRQEVKFLAERIQQLRQLQRSQKHLTFITIHIQDHIEKLQARLHELVAERKVS